MPAPTTMASVKRSGRRESGAKRIGRVEPQRRLTRHVRMPADARYELVAPRLEPTREAPTRDALRLEDLTGRQQSARMQRRQLGRGPRTARRPIVGAARTHHEVAPVRRRQLHVVDRGAMLARDALGVQGIHDRDGDARQLALPRHRQWLIGQVRDEEPVSAIGNVADHATKSRHINRDVTGMTTRDHVSNRDRSFGTTGHAGWNRSGGSGRRRSGHGSNRRVQSYRAGTKTAEILERAHDTDGPVTTHAEVSDIVKENHARGRLSRDRWRQVRAHERIVPARLADDRAPEMIMELPHGVAAIRHGIAQRLRPALEHHASRLALRMRVDHANHQRNMTMALTTREVRNVTAPKPWSRS